MELNQVAEISQTTISSLASNSALLTFTGDSNGVGSFGTLAGSVGLTESEDIQDNSGSGLDSVSYTVTGNDNLFAFQQTGTGVTITGTVGGIQAPLPHQVAVSQAGSNDTATFFPNRQRPERRCRQAIAPIPGGPSGRWRCRSQRNIFTTQGHRSCNEPPTYPRRHRHRPADDCRRVRR